MAPFNTVSDASCYFESSNYSNKNTGDVSNLDESLRRPKFSKCEDSSLYYDMTKGKILIIFNHFRYKKTRHYKYVPCARVGTYQDVKSLEKTFRNLGFMVITHDDWNYRDVMEYLSQVCTKDHSNTSCIAIAIMTHGKGVHVCASDRMYPVADITDMLRTAPNLFGKPKLFFIQACRERHTKPRSQRNDVIVPVDADCLVLYSTYEDYLSYRNRNTGSWLMQALCKVVESDHRTVDLVSMVPSINNIVASKSTLEGFKQTPVTELYLTKYLML